MRNYFIILLFSLLVIILMPAAVFADQDGNDFGCNIEQYGCWVYNDDG